MTETLKSLRAKAIKLQQSNDLDAAARAYATYLALNPSDAGIWSNLGVLHRQKGRHRMALRAHRRAVSLAPRDNGLLNNFANTLSDVGDYDHSIAVRRRIVAADKETLNQLAMIGRCLRGKGDYRAAIDHLEDALHRHPDDPELQLQLAFALLGAGEYVKGFAAYKARWKSGELKPRSLNCPEWQGQNLKGKSITVLPEQGFGDAVLFMRFLPFLKNLDARVSVAAEGPMLRLFQNLEGADEVVPLRAAMEKTDYWVNMMDLAGPFFAANQAVPEPACLTIPADSEQKAKHTVARFQSKYKVGVVWSGSATYKGNAFRSFSHNDFLPLSDIPNVQLFSLYKGPFLDGFYDDGADTVMIDAGSQDRDFADCAALMKELDLVITSDTATAHIAGSLGVPVWVVLHWDPFWVWTHRGETTPWYPSVRLFRQNKPLEWSGVLAEVEMALRQTLKEVSHE